MDELQLLEAIRLMIKEETRQIIQEETRQIIQEETRQIVKEETRQIIQEETRQIVKEETRQIIQEELAPIQQDLLTFKNETASNFQKVDEKFQHAQADRTEIKEHIAEVADTLEGGLAILDKVEQRLNPVADYVENVIFHANESNPT